jgi:ribosomal protein S18 acetylase RimI-like enzyme
MNPASDITIRFASANDANLVAELSQQTFYETFAPYNTPENMDKFMKEQFTHEELEKEVLTAGNIFLLAYIRDEVVGYVRIREGERFPQFGTLPSMEIVRIYALQSSIGTGVGKALMEKSITLARGSGKKIVWLGVWEKNERAIRFYTKWGFRRFGEHDFLLGNDLQTDWLMMKQLDP